MPEMSANKQPQLHQQQKRKWKQMNLFADSSFSTGKYVSQNLEIKSMEVLKSQWMALTQRNCLVFVSSLIYGQNQAQNGKI